MADTVKQYTNIAIGDLGNQLFWFNKDSTFKDGAATGGTTGAFEYALPVTAGAEFGGDTESFEAPETDLDYVPKIGGRTTLNDIEYTANYTKEKYARARQITSNTIDQVYMEVFSDGSAAIFKGTCGIPSIQAGDVRPLGLTIAPDFLYVVSDIYSLSQDDKNTLDGLVADMKETYKTKAKDYATLNVYDNTNSSLIIDTLSIPTQRAKFEASKTDAE